MDRSLIKQNHLVSTIVWIAMILALLSYLGVLTFLTQSADATKDVDHELIQTLTIAFSGLSLMALIGVAILRKLLFFKPLEARDFDSSKELMAGYFTMCIVTWALIEAIAIYGFVLSILSYEMVYYLVFMGPSLALLLYFRPTVKKWVRQYERDNPDMGSDDGDDDGEHQEAVW